MPNALRSVNANSMAGVVSAPLWRSTLNEDTLDTSKRPGFAGMITVNDIIHLIQYYHYTAANYDSAKLDVETLRLERLREIEHALNVPPPPLLWIGPLSPLTEAGELLVRTHARRLPLLDYNEDLRVESVLSVLTQYRLLKFIAMNCRETSGLKASIGSLGIGTYTYAHQLERKRRTPHARLRMQSETPPPPDAGPFWPLLTATLDTTVFDVVHMFSDNGISAVPIIDDEGDVVDIYESVDVMTLLRTGAYYQLDLTIRQALERRPADYAGIVCCSSDDSLASIFTVLKQRRMHRMLIIDPVCTESEPPTPNTSTESLVEENVASIPLCPKGRLVGVLSLCDVLRYIIGQPTQPVDVTPLPGSTSDAHFPPSISHTASVSTSVSASAPTSSTTTSTTSSTNTSTPMPLSSSSTTSPSPDMGSVMKTGTDTDTDAESGANAQTFVPSMMNRSPSESSGSSVATTTYAGHIPQTTPFS